MYKFHFRKKQKTEGFRFSPLIVARQPWSSTHPPHTHAALPLLLPTLYCEIKNYKKKRNHYIFIERKTTISSPPSGSIHPHPTQEHATRWIGLVCWYRSKPYWSVCAVVRRLLPSCLRHVWPNEGNAEMVEYNSIFWDSVHYMPWVYEELNNLLLNMLCNTAGGGTSSSEQLTRNTIKI